VIRYASLCTAIAVLVLARPALGGDARPNDEVCKKAAAKISDEKNTKVVANLKKVLNKVNSLFRGPTKNQPDDTLSALAHSQLKYALTCSLRSVKRHKGRVELGHRAGHSTRKSRHVRICSGDCIAMTLSRWCDLAEPTDPTPGGGYGWGTIGHEGTHQTQNGEPKPPDGYEPDDPTHEGTSAEFMEYEMRRLLDEMEAAAGNILGYWAREQEYGCDLPRRDRVRKKACRDKAKYKRVFGNVFNDWKAKTGHGDTSAEAQEWANLLKNACDYFDAVKARYSPEN